MVGGAIIVAMCLVALGWTAEMVGLFVSEPELKKSCTVATAVLSIYAVDFAINAVQSSCRSLIVDTLPISKQQLGSAWASRMVAVGALAGYAVGTVDLPGTFGKFFGDTQFKQLCLIAAVFFLSTVCITAWAVEERILISSKDADVKSGVLRTLGQIIKTALNLPDRIQAICWVQFWAWIGWFPFLFYSATWVGEVYFRYHPESDAKSSADALGEVGRIGSLSLVVFSFITLLSSVLLPWIVQSPADTTASNNSKTPYDQSQSSFTPRPPPMLEPLASTLLIPMFKFLQTHKPDLLTAWQYSHLIFASSMIFAPFVRSIGMATLLVSLCGIPWAMACWAPFAFMGIEINRLTLSSSNPSSTLPNGHHTHTHTHNHHSSRPASVSYRRYSNPPPSGADDFSASSGAPTSPTFLRLHHLDRDLDDTLDLEDGIPGIPGIPGSSSGQATTGETAGVYLGILNLFTTLPQFVGTFISGIVFSVLEPGKSPELHEATQAQGEGEGKRDGLNAIAVCLFIGAISAAGAAVATGRMRRIGGGGR